MKLNTLLLTSAATLMATSVAFAADLPSKKAAPAGGAVQVCKVAGKTGFQLPGSDTCVVLGGFVRLDTKWKGSRDGVFSDATDGAPYEAAAAAFEAAPDLSMSHKISLKVGAYTNTEMGALASNFDLRGSTSGIAVDSASISLGGFKAGVYDSNFGMLDGGSYLYGSVTPSTKSNQIGYSAALGGATVGLNYEFTQVDSQDSGDVVGTVDFAVGGVKLHVGGSSHMAEETGYGIDVGANVGIGAGTNLAVEYAYIKDDGARAADAAAGLGDWTIGDDSSANIVAAELSHAFSSSLTGYVHGTWGSFAEVGYADWTSTLVGVGVDFQPVKGLHVQPEVSYVDYSDEGTEEGTATRAMVRIQRDF